MSEKNNLEMIKQKILEAKSFEEARILIFEDEYWAQFINESNKAFKIELIKLLAHKSSEPRDILTVIDYLEALNNSDELLSFIRSPQCLFKSNPFIKARIAKIEGDFGNINNAIEYAPSACQRAALLRKQGKLREARDEIEQGLLCNITEYEVNAYVGIINEIMKKDEDAQKLNIPSICCNIASGEVDWHFNFKRLLKQVLKYEQTYGNKDKAKITENILNNFKSI